LLPMPNHPTATNNSLQTRRQFIKQSTALASGAGLGLALSSRLGAQGMGANGRVVFGLIGCGTMGRENMRHFLELNQPVAAVCDVDQSHLERAAAEVVKAGQAAPKKFKDFRQLLEQKDIDAVIIGTPDHWHALTFIAACEAGKDIYCEKPISHSLVEAKAMLGAARHFNRVVQIGTWQRSMKHFQDAIAFVRSGKLGKINLCRAWMCYYLPDIGRQSPQPPPAGLDWDFWLGPSPMRPYQPNRCHEHWRWFYDTGGSLMSDWGVHMIDIVLLAMRESDPVSIVATGGKLATNDDRDTPDTLEVTYRFPKWLLNWEHRFNNPRGLDGGKEHGAEFIGDNGSLVVDRGGYRFYPYPPDREGPPRSEWVDSTHWQNFLDCLKSRNQPASGIESMAKTTIVCHLGNIAFQSGRILNWDARQQDVAHPRDVKDCVSYEREYRSPWNLKVYS
ncbi:MAG: Gfo/Idh/MocA family oxidoreductase, partial [Verrucomicrobiota bacterium]